MDANWNVGVEGRLVAGVRFLNNLQLVVVILQGCSDVFTVRK